jgi:hypothetical protein
MSETNELVEEARVLPRRRRAAGRGQDAGDGPGAPQNEPQAAQGAVPEWRGASGLAGMLVPIADLVPSPNNARRHELERDVRVIAESLRRFGQQKPIVARPGSREVIAGNGTLRAAATLLGWTHLAVSWFEGTDEEAQAYALVDNRSAELSDWDLQVLSGQLREICRGCSGGTPRRSARCWRPSGRRRPWSRCRRPITARRHLRAG